MMIETRDQPGSVSQGTDGSPAAWAIPLRGPSGRNSTSQTIAETTWGTAMGSNSSVLHKPAKGRRRVRRTASPRASAICSGLMTTENSNVTLTEFQKDGSVKMYAKLD